MSTSHPQLTTAQGKKINVLAIETSCDETAIAIVEGVHTKGGIDFSLLAHALHSQIETHAMYGGVFPNMARREHVKNIVPLTLEALHRAQLLHKKDGVQQAAYPQVEEILAREAELYTQFLEYIAPLEKPAIDAIAVTVGPGLAPALWVGVNWAKALAQHFSLPLITVNHMEGHIVASLLQGNKILTPDFPILSLLVSGGHTEMVLTDESFTHKKIGATLDDAVGEAFDKVARLLGLPYPGGPALSRLAQEARDASITPVPLPRPMLHDASLNFSYAGLKTAVRVYVEKNPIQSETDRLAIALGFENAAVESLLHKLKKAVAVYAPQTLIIGGGVSANVFLRKQINALSHEHPHMHTYIPDAGLSTDNAIMIAMVALLHPQVADIQEVRANAQLSFPV